MKINSNSKKELEDYNIYILSLKERLLYTVAAAAAVYLIAYIFYRSSMLSLILCPLALLYPRIKTKELIKRRKTELNIQFKDMLYSLSSSMSAGKPIERAFKDVLKDLEILYPDPNTLIIKEVENIVKKIELNETVESALSDFAQRAHVNDIENFVDVLRTCKRSGGNIVEIIKNTSNIISDKIEIKHDIDSLLAERRLERKVLNIMPLAMVIFLSAVAGDYIEPVFTTVAGRIVMTISVGLIAAAYVISKKIMDINL